MIENGANSSIPGYVSTQEAAKILGVSKHRLYQYAKANRLPVIKVGKSFMFPRDAVEQFQRNPSGRVRTQPPSWYAYRSRGNILSTEIRVSVRPGQQNALLKKLKAIQKENRHTFPGTMSRYIFRSDKDLTIISIVLLWKDTEMPSEIIREQSLEEFRQELADIVNWDTATYETKEAIIHT